MAESHSTRSRRLGLALLVILVVTDAVLIFLVFRSQEPVTAVAGPDTGGVVQPTDPPETTTPSETPDPQPTSPTVEPTATPALVETREVPLSVLDADTALLGIPGECPGEGGSVLHTTDGGEEWSPLDIPGSSAVLRVRAVRSSDFWFIGTDEECAPTFVRSTNGGDSWRTDADTGGAWHLLADPQSKELHAPDGDVDSPCTDTIAVELEGVSTSVAYVLCGDGSVHRTGNGGQSWRAAGSAPGAVAMGMAGETVVVAAEGVDDCSGLAVQTVTPDETTLQACVEDATASGAGLAFADQRVGFLVVGESTWTTTNAGRAWQPAA